MIDYTLTRKRKWAKFCYGASPKNSNSVLKIVEYEMSNILKSARDSFIRYFRRNLQIIGKPKSKYVLKM